MNSLHRSPKRPRRAGFSLVEVMIACTIIGLMAMLATPAITRARLAAQNARFVSDLRTFAQAFETYSLENGQWPPNAGSGVIPTGMPGNFRADSWRTPKNSIGGRWNWDRNNYGGAAVISVANATASDIQMVLIDAKIDDGNLGSGLFQKVSDRFCYILEETAP
jgi:prepilin-type N-terminal cleavage/methylation domain-containing protein